MEHVILVDKNDNQIGTKEKLEAHRQGLLHRAFSVFLFDTKGRMLLQQRAKSKYHSGGLWTNACCSHPRPGEDIRDAAYRRLKEELGIEADVRKAFAFIYQAKLAGGLVEHELDHVFLGTYEGAIDPNPEEVETWRYVSMQDLFEDIRKNPASYTVWFKIALERVLSVWEREKERGILTLP